MSFEGNNFVREYTERGTGWAGYIGALPGTLVALINEFASEATTWLVAFRNGDKLADLETTLIILLQSPHNSLLVQILWFYPHAHALAPK